MGGKQKGMSEVLSQSAGDGTLSKDEIRTGGEAETAAGRAQAAPFEHALNAALEGNRIAEARTLVANAEAVLAAHGTPASGRSERTSRSQLAVAKARIAIATGDGAAARAILVRAIETNPKVPALRVLMTEVMMAAGRATEVRPVLQHLGNGPSVGRDPADGFTPPPPKLRDTSG